MIIDILNAFKETIEAELWQTGGKPVKVDYVNLESPATPLEVDTINLLLFSSSERRDLLGNETFGIPTEDNLAIQQKPALKLSLNVLLIFNLKSYTNAVDCYSQILGNFYNHNVLPIYFNGSEIMVDVLLSGFDDRNEIEIRNSFNIPGTPLLRYDLNYALVQGKMKRLPIVQKTGLKSNVPSKEIFIPEAILNLICTPVEDCMLLVQQAGNHFIHLKLEKGEEDVSIITRSYKEIMAAYEMAHDELKRIEKIKEATTFKFAINKLIIALNDNKIRLEGKWRKLDLENNPTRWESIYDAMKSEIEGYYEVTTQYKKTFLTELSIASKYKQITTSILKAIEGFNEVGNSLYKPVKPYTIPSGFSFQKSLSDSQEKTKWWQLEEKLKALYKTYEDEIKEYLSDSTTTDFEEFKKVLEELRKQLKEPLERIEELNLEYNRKAYSEAYSKAYLAVNYKDGNEKSVEDYLAGALEKFLKGITK